MAWERRALRIVEREGAYNVKMKMHMNERGEEGGAMQD